MDLSIALNTIIYILFLLVPGLLFRRFYYSGQFTKQFYQANLLERFLWTLLHGVGIIVTLSLTIEFTRGIFDTSFLPAISYTTLYDLHKLLVSDKLPSPIQAEKISADIGIFIVLLYFFASLLGFSCSRLVVSLNLDKIFPVLRYQNRWYYILSGKLYAPKKTKRLRTYADVLVETNLGNILYSGIVKDYFINSKMNSLESIIIADSHRWKDNKKKAIEGDTLVIEGARILNINFRYSGFKGDYATRNTIVDNVNAILFILLLLGIFFLEYLFFNSPYLISWFRKIVFASFAILLVVTLLITIQRIFKVQPKDEKQSWRGIIAGWVFSSTPLIMMFYKFSFWETFGRLLVFIIVFSFFFSGKKK